MTTSIFILRFRAMAAIDSAADEARRAFITDIAGQQAVYLEKRTEAALYIAAHGANPATAVPGPHIAAEAEQTGQSPLVVANIIMANATQWLTVHSPAIESRRVAGKARVQAATTEQDIEAERNASVAEILAVAQGA